MQLSQDQLKAFYEVSRQGGFTKAAHFLGITQSALSQRVKNLESMLQTTLFVRASDGVRLTNSGEKLLQYVTVQTQIESEFIDELKMSGLNQVAGLLRIGGVSSQMWSIIVPSLSDFLKSNTNIQAEFSVHEVYELTQMLKSGAVDFIITTQTLELPAYEEIYLGDEINVLVEAKDQSQILDMYLDHDAQDLTTIQYLKLNAQQSQKIKRAYFDNIYGIIAAVKAGLGRAVMPLHLLKEHKQLKPVAQQKKLKHGVYLYYLRQPFYSQLTTAVVSCLKNEVPKHLSRLEK